MINGRFLQPIKYFCTCSIFLYITYLQDYIFENQSKRVYHLIYSHSYIYLHLMYTNKDIFSYDYDEIFLQMDDDDSVGRFYYQ